jgi:pyruvate formate lyase activating enzyme
MPEAVSLQNTLQSWTREGDLYEKLPDQKLRCFACGHRCLIAPGHPGICRVRFNEEGTLKVPWGYVGALQLDPVEKKPFFHALPGSRALSFGMLGCDFHCGYCQNWVTSQSLRDPESTTEASPMTPDQFIKQALQHKARIVTSTYNEPLITSEWAVAIFKQAKAKGLVTSYVSNGNGTPEVLEYIRPWVDLYNVDLKSFRDQSYRSLGGVLDHVTDTIQRLHRMGFWVEIVTLLIPGFNDSPEEIKDMSQFIASVSLDIPWHVTAFHKDYKMTDPDNTTAKDLEHAAEIGAIAGLRYVYAGNLPGKVGQWENTFCPTCKTPLIERYGFQILANNLKEDSCPKCGQKIPGVWNVQWPRN